MTNPLVQTCQGISHILTLKFQYGLYKMIPKLRKWQVALISLWQTSFNNIRVDILCYIFKYSLTLSPKIFSVKKVTIYVFEFREMLDYFFSHEINV
jgi:hypothetical protein